MKIYCISGYCGDGEDGTIRQVHQIYTSRETAESVINDMIAETRGLAQEAEDIKGSANDNGMWTDKISTTHGSKHIISQYECEVSVDLNDEAGLELFRRLSAVGLLGGGDFSIANGIKVEHLFSALSFKVANLTLSVKEI